MTRLAVTLSGRGSNLLARHAAIAAGETPTLNRPRHPPARPGLEPLPDICQTNPMDRESILATLRAHQPELVAAGLLHLRLFGSVARGDSTPDSDVDLLFNFDESRRLNVLKAYRLQDYLTDMLGTQTHLSSEIHLRPQFKAEVLAESIDVY